MPKKAVSLTLDADNLLWLKGRARLSAGGNVSEAVNRLISEARTGRPGVPTDARSIVGTIDIAAADPGLEAADAAVRGLFTASLARPLLVREKTSGLRPARRKHHE